jgi:GGDEF domain-containing protein
VKIALITDDTSLKPPTEDVELVICSPEGIDTKKLDDYGAIILDARKTEIAKAVLKNIRQSETEAIALKPVFFFNPRTADVEVESLSDGRVDFGRIAESVATAESILKSLATLTELKTESFETAAMLRILRFLYTRKIKLVPVISPSSKYGYIYPIAAHQFPDTEDWRVFEMLALMERENLILGTFVDRMHHCNKCYSGFMNFREICPTCRSAYLSVENVVHHFPCGAVYPESKFSAGDQLICPKCNKVLRHIGMDYEKPSVIFECHGCEATFQEPSVEVFCFHCQAKSPVEQTIVHDVKVYELTPTGANCAIHGLRFSIADFLKDKLDLVEYAHFKRLLALESERKKRYKRESSVGFLQITNFQDVYMQVGERKNELALEMAKIIKDALRKTDVISALNESTFLLLLLETPPEKAKVALERVKVGIGDVLRNNFSLPEKTFIPQISVNTVPADESSLNTLF